MTTITDTFHDAANHPTTAVVNVRAYDYRAAADGHTITPEPRAYQLGPLGEFSATVEPGPTVFEICIKGLPVRSRIVNVPEDGTYVLSDLVILADPGTANLSATVLDALSGVTWADLA